MNKIYFEYKDGTEINVENGNLTLLTYRVKIDAFFKLSVGDACLVKKESVSKVLDFLKSYNKLSHNKYLYDVIDIFELGSYIERMMFIITQKELDNFISKDSYLKGYDFINNTQENIPKKRKKYKKNTHGKSQEEESKEFVGDYEASLYRDFNYMYKDYMQLLANYLTDTNFKFKKYDTGYLKELIDAIIEKYRNDIKYRKKIKSKIEYLKDSDVFSFVIINTVHLKTDIEKEKDIIEKIQDIFYMIGLPNRNNFSHNESYIYDLDIEKQQNNIDYLYFATYLGNLYIDRFKKYNYRNVLNYI